MADTLQTKSPTDFVDSKEWREHVRQTASPEEVDYTLAMGRTTLFLRLYEVRKQAFPYQFQVELFRVGQLSDPERTQALEALNDRIFADMTQFLFVAASSVSPEGSDNNVPSAPGEIVNDLLGYLVKNNPYFALWVHFTERVRHTADAPPWEEFARQKLETKDGDELEFTLLMGQLGYLLHDFRDRGHALPPYSCERMWFLHHLRGAERNLQARAMVQGLVEAMESCAFV